MTRSIYLNDTYLFEYKSIIKKFSSDERGAYAVLDETIFYPQGGGQPADQGIIKIHDRTFQIDFVRQIDQEIRHYFVGHNEELNNLINAHLSINAQRRLLNARYHTAAHLLGNIVEMIEPNLKAVKGHSFPGEAYVEFIGTGMLEVSIIENRMNEIISQNIKTSIFTIMPNEFEERFYKLSYPVPTHTVFRVMQIQGFMPIPCGGTHIAELNEIEKIVIKKIISKSGRIKISYEVI